MVECFAATLSWVLADLIAQAVETGQLCCPSASLKSLDAVRLCSAAVWGFVVYGLVVHHWFGLLSVHFPQARTYVLQLEAKITVNQIFFALVITTFFGYTILTRVPPRMRMTVEKRKKLCSKLLSGLSRTIGCQLAFWITVQHINFILLPDDLHVIVNACASLLSNVVVSLLAAF